MSKKDNGKANGNQSQPANQKRESVVQIQELRKMLDSGYGRWTSKVENSTGKPLTPEDFAVLSQGRKTK